MFTRGRAKSQTIFDEPGITDQFSEGPDTTELGLNGRIGMYARLGGSAGLFGHIGQVLSYASAGNSEGITVPTLSYGKVSWWSSTHEGAVGLAFDF